MTRGVRCRHPGPDPTQKYRREPIQSRVKDVGDIPFTLSWDCCIFSNY